MSQKVKHGKWIEKEDDSFPYFNIPLVCKHIICSVCGEEAFYDEVHGYYDDIEKYCHNCGARMDGEENEIQRDN